MAPPHKRPPFQPPLTELIQLRRARYPDVMQRDFATKMLGVSRLHMTAIETGRRRPSLDLVLRWLELLAPDARLDMFGDVPVIAERIAAIKQLQKLSPEFFQAA